jgi:5-methylcytosine-specific restriction endonuclease McrA
MREIALKSRYGTWMKGKKLSEETKKKIGIAGTGRKKLNPITPENKRIRCGKEWKKWRQLVFQRDNYQCQQCGVKNAKGLGKTVELNPDHIKPFALFPELRFDVNNGRTLCRPCHMKTDTWGYRKIYR